MFTIGDLGSFFIPDTRIQKRKVDRPMVYATLSESLHYGSPTLGRSAEYGIAIPAVSWYPVCLKKGNGDEKVI